MVIVKITEGFGNQLFKYACAYRVSKEKNTKLHLDLSFCKFENRPYMLDKLNIDAEEWNFRPAKYNNKFSRGFAKIRRRFKLGFITQIIKENANKLYLYDKMNFKKKNIYIEGYWQNLKYFEKYDTEIRKQFTPRHSLTSDTIRIIREVKSCLSVAIHLRRGDYCNDWLLPESYFIQAYKNMKERLIECKFYIFCEDTQYASQLFGDEPNICIVSKVIKIDDFEEFFLMSSCRNQIISNSSYSWWAAYLNENKEKIVVAPEFKQWKDDFYPSEWIKIKI